MSGLPPHWAGTFLIESYIDDNIKTFRIIISYDL